MHRLIEERLEEILAGSSSAEIERHLESCAPCRDEVARMQAHASMLRELRPAAEAAPAPGFYARVMNRIDAEGQGSIWNMFLDPAFGLRIAFASMALLVMMGAYLVSAEQSVASVEVAELEQQVSPVLVLDQQPITTDPDQVLVSLASYRQE